MTLRAVCWGPREGVWERGLVPMERVTDTCSYLIGIYEPGKVCEEEGPRVDQLEITTGHLENHTRGERIRDDQPCSPFH